MTNKQQKYALITKFKKNLKEKGLDDSMNVYAEQWAADDLIKSYGLSLCYELIDYYFKVSDRPSWKWFIYNAEKVYQSKKIKEEDDRIRELMRKKAKDWLGK